MISGHRAMTNPIPTTIPAGGSSTGKIMIGVAIAVAIRTFFDFDLGRSLAEFLERASRSVTGFYGSQLCRGGRAVDCGLHCRDRPVLARRGDSDSRRRVSLRERRCDPFRQYWCDNRRDAGISRCALSPA